MENIKQIKVNEELHDVEDAQARKDIAAETRRAKEAEDNRIKKFYTSNLGETSIADSDDGAVRNLVIDGRCAQTTTKGYNLLPNHAVDSEIKGITFTVNPDGSITANGTANYFADQYIYGQNADNGEYITLEKGDYAIHGSLSPKDNNTYIVFFRTVEFGAIQASTAIIRLKESDLHIYGVFFRIVIDVAVKNLTIYPMIERGTIAHDYEPYTGGAPSPSPDYPQEIKSVVNPKVKVCGKNLFNPDSLVENGACTYSNDEIKVVNVNKLANITVPLSIKAGNNINLSFYVKGVKEQSFIVGLKYTNGNRQGITILINANEFVYKSKTINLSEDLEGIFFGGSGGLGNGTIIKKLQIEIGSQSTEYEPHKEQVASLPYTLNAIPVSSGGNVTIDGQQYIADYVDVERGKVIRNILKWNLADRALKGFNNVVWHMNISELGIDGSKIGLSNMFKIQSGNYNGVTTSELHINYDGQFVALNMKGMTDEEFKKWLSDKNPEVYNVLKVAEEIPINQEEITALKELATYYPTTNIIVNSEQLDGYTVFNYPISMANGWNYVKQQLNDNRDYIYDMELQSAEAYVNSEYAVILTELGV